MKAWAYGAWETALPSRQHALPMSSWLLTWLKSRGSWASPVWMSSL